MPYDNSDRVSNTASNSEVISKALTGTYNDIKKSMFQNNTYLDITDTVGRTILHALFRNDKITESEMLTLTKRLVDLGAPIDKPETTYNIRPIHIAAKNQHYTIIDFLTSKGADPSSRTNGNLTPLHYAVSPQVKACKGDNNDGKNSGESVNEDTQKLCNDIYELMKNDQTFLLHMKHFETFTREYMQSNDEKVREIVNETLKEIIKKAKGNVFNRKLVDNHMEQLNEKLNKFIEKAFIDTIKITTTETKRDEVLVPTKLNHFNEIYNMELGLSLLSNNDYSSFRVEPYVNNTVYGKTKAIVSQSIVKLFIINSLVGTNGYAMNDDTYIDVDRNGDNVIIPAKTAYTSRYSNEIDSIGHITQMINDQNSLDNVIDLMTSSGNNSNTGNDVFDNLVNLYILSITNIRQIENINIVYDDRMSIDDNITNYIYALNDIASNLKNVYVMFDKVYALRYAVSQMYDSANTNTGNVFDDTDNNRMINDFIIDNAQSTKSFITRLDGDATQNAVRVHRYENNGVVFYANENREYMQMFAQPVSNNPVFPAGVYVPVNTGNGSFWTLNSDNGPMNIYFRVHDLVKYRYYEYIKDNVPHIFDINLLNTIVGNVSSMHDTCASIHGNVCKIFERVQKKLVFDAIFIFNNRFMTADLKDVVVNGSVLNNVIPCTPLLKFDEFNTQFPMGSRTESDIIDNYLIELPAEISTDINNMPKLQFSNDILLNATDAHSHMLKNRLTDHILHAVVVNKYDNGILNKYTELIKVNTDKKSQYLIDMLEGVVSNTVIDSFNRIIKRTVYVTLDTIINDDNVFNPNNEEYDTNSSDNYIKLLSKPDCAIIKEHVINASYKYDVQMKDETDEHYHELVDGKTNERLCYMMNSKTVESLLKAGADVRAMDNSRKTPIDYAIDIQNTAVIGLLTKYGAPRTDFSVERLTKQLINSIEMSPLLMINDIVDTVENKMATDFNVNRVPIKGNNALRMTAYLIDHHLTHYMNSYPNMWNDGLMNTLLEYTGSNAYSNSHIPLVHNYDSNRYEEKNRDVYIKLNKYREQLNTIINSIENLELERTRLVNDNADTTYVDDLLTELTESKDIHEVKIIEYANMLKNTTTVIDFDKDNIMVPNMYATNSRIRLIDTYDDIYAKIPPTDDTYDDIIMKGVNYNKLWNTYLSSVSPSDSTQVLHAVYRSINETNIRENINIIDEVFTKIYGKYANDLLTLSQYIDGINVSLYDMSKMLTHIVSHTISFDFINMSIGLIVKHMNNNDAVFVSTLLSDVNSTGYHDYCVGPMTDNIVKGISKIRTVDDVSEIDINSELEKAVTMFIDRTSVQLNASSIGALKGDLVNYMSKYYNLYLTEMYKMINDQMKLLLEQKKLLNLIHAMIE
jgi:ankyrin repeat protein